MKFRLKRFAKCMVAAYLPETLVSVLPYHPQRHHIESAEGQHHSGYWDYLNSGYEAARYGIISAFLKHYAEGASVLDIGCGQGILVHHLPLDRIESYQGIDIAPSAINSARERFHNPKIQFEVADVLDFHTLDSFKLMVFNEVLYYFEDPIQLVRRYSQSLEKNGYVVISMFDMLKSRKIQDQLDGVLMMVSRARAVNHFGHSWTISVYQKQ